MSRIHVVWRFLDTGLELATDPATGILREWHQPADLWRRHSGR